MGKWYLLFQYSESKTADPAFIAAKAQADAIASHVKQLGGKFTEISEGKAKKSKKSKQAATSAEYKDSDVETRENLTHHAVVVVDTNAFAADTGVSMRVVLILFYFIIFFIIIIVFIIIIIVVWC